MLPQGGSIWQNSAPFTEPAQPIAGNLNVQADVAKLVYALDLGSSGATRESSSLSVRTI